MLFNRIQVFIFCLLFITSIYHFLHSHPTPIHKPTPSSIYYQPIHLFIHTIPSTHYPLINHSKAYRTYQQKRTRTARRKHITSTII